MSTKIVLSFVVIIPCICLACNSSRPSAKDGIVSSDSVLPQWEENGLAYYKRVNPPSLHFDTTRMFDQMRELLAFTNKIPSSQLYQFYDVSVTIDSLGNKLLGTPGSVEPMGKALASMDTLLIRSIAVDAPASLIADSTIKVSYQMESKVIISEKHVELSISGVEQRLYLRKIFKRPL